MKTYIIKKTHLDNTEILPHITETGFLWDEYDTPNHTKRTTIAGILYQAVFNRENYMQEHTETAYGSPEQGYYIGVVDGVCKSFDITEEHTETTIKFCIKGKPLLIVDKLKRDIPIKTGFDQLMEQTK